MVIYWIFAKNVGPIPIPRCVCDITTRKWRYIFVRENTSYNSIYIVCLLSKVLWRIFDFTVCMRLVYSYGSINNAITICNANNKPARAFSNDIVQIKIFFQRIKICKY